MANELQFAGGLNYTGLTVTANVYEADGTLVEADIAMTETGSTGIYLADMSSSATQGKHVIQYISDSVVIGLDADYYWTANSSNLHFETEQLVRIWQRLDLETGNGNEYQGTGSGIENGQWTIFAVVDGSGNYFTSYTET